MGQFMCGSPRVESLVRRLNGFRDRGIVAEAGTSRLQDEVFDKREDKAGKDAFGEPYWLARMIPSGGLEHGSSHGGSDDSHQDVYRWSVVRRRQRPDARGDQTG